MKIFYTLPARLFPVVMYLVASCSQAVESDKRSTGSPSEDDASKSIDTPPTNNSSQNQNSQTNKNNFAEGGNIDDSDIALSDDEKAIQGASKKAKNVLEVTLDSKSRSAISNALADGAWKMSPNALAMSSDIIVFRKDPFSDGTRLIAEVGKASLESQPNHGNHLSFYKINVVNMNFEIISATSRLLTLKSPRDQSIITLMLQ